VNYFNRIADKHTYDALKQVVDALNQLRDGSKQANTAIAAVAASVPQINQIQQQLQAGGSAPLNLAGLSGVAAPVTVGTHAQRIATVAKAGSFWVESDRLLTYVGSTTGTTAVWLYESGYMFDSFANRPTDFGANDANALYVPSEHLHWCRWGGATWTIIDDDGGTFIDSARALGAGYQLCDGSATTYLTASGANLVETAFTTPNENSAPAGVYHKSIAAYTGTINAAVAPAGVAGTTGNDSASVAVQSGAGTTVAADPHTHPFTPVVDATGEPRNIGVLRYLRR
jgi:uncharacterized phage infection (PIP) family protein YhgE